MKLKKKGIKIIKSYLIRTQEDFHSMKLDKESAGYFYLIIRVINMVDLEKLLIGKY
ncbi:MAG: hypothetical protein Ct9H90mP3_4550 [Flammeovirgaceae bacterium]|nr:MAG: hypothetical protein Ct9H90mP3_4550 [Flammeovirgaceae bacterium]